jgi:hypothetical protein
LELEDGLGGGRLEGVASFDGWNVEGSGGSVLPRIGVLQIEPPSLAGDGGVTLKLEGKGGARYLIEVSDDLVNWSSLGVASANALGRIEFTDRDSGANSHRFYRARRLEE